MKIEEKVGIEWYIHLSHKLGINLKNELSKEELEKLKVVLK